MTQELAQTQENLPIDPKDLINQLTNIKDGVSNVQSGLPILKMNGKTGVWTYGVERIAVEPGQLWAVDARSFKHGYICWDNAEPIGEIMREAGEPLPTEDELPDYGKRWDLQNTCIMRCMTGEDAGLVCINKGSSLGHQKMVRDLTAAIIGRIETGTDAYYPIVDLAFDSYVNRKQGAEIFNPIMEIVDWKTFEEIMSDDIAELETMTEEDEVEVEPEPEKPQPRQRRRKTVGTEQKAQTRQRRRSV